MDPDQIEAYILDMDSEFSDTDNEDFLDNSDEDLNIIREQKPAEVDSCEGPSINFQEEIESNNSLGEENIFNFTPNWVPGDSFSPDEHDFSESHGLRNCDLSENSSQADFFELFINREVVSFLVTETNRYCENVKSTQQLPPHSRLHKWREVNVEEMYIFLALTILMARVKKSKISQYWTTRRSMQTPFFGEVMPRDRYLSILSMLHFSNDANKISGDRLYKIREFAESICSKFKKYFYPTQNLAIDESLVLFKGRLIFKQYIPSKRRRFGIKLFVIGDCATGMILDFIIYCGANTDYRAMDRINESLSKELGMSGKVDLSLLTDYLDKGHTLYVDNWYTSPILFAYLHNKKTNACGTAKKNRKNMPVFDKIKKGEMISKM